MCVRILKKFYTLGTKHTLRLSPAVPVDPVITCFMINLTHQKNRKEF